METIMVTGGLGFTGRHITKRLAAGGHRVVSYNRDFAPREDEIVMAQGELFDVARLVRVLKAHGKGPFDGTEARRDLGYEPEWGLERGIVDYAAWLKTHDW